jgi:hypothetical protein
MSGPKYVLAGAVLGLAWTSALRSYMSELVGSASRIEWIGTFAQILLPGVLVGALLGLAEYFRRTGGRRGWRWLAAAPVLFALAPQFTPGAFVTFVSTGLGGGAIAVALVGILGGLALSGRGPRWGRVVAGVPALALTLGGAVAYFGFDQRFVGGFSTVHGVWVALLFTSLMVVFAVACSIPHRRVVAATRGVEATA